jgi:N-acetylmuramoyl-L-alanine amidase
MPSVPQRRTPRFFLTVAGLGLGLGLALDRPAVAGHLPLAAVQEALGCTGRVIRADSIDIGDGTNCVRFYPGLRRSEVNGSTVWLHTAAEPAGISNLVTLDARDVREVLLPLLRMAPPAGRPLRVMLDPGHGGEDSGAVSAQPAIEEKHLVLDLALRIGQRLEAAGLTVGYTRRNDSFLSLDARTATACVWRADAFVSLHANFAENRKATGPETYVLPFAGYAPTGGDQRISDRPQNGNSNDVCNTRLGYSIHRRLPGRGGEADRGLRRARFQVLRQAGCPAVLVEVGFLSNVVEARLLASGWFRDRLARAVAGGVLDYACQPAADPSGGDAPEAPAKGEAILTADDAPVSPAAGEGTLVGCDAPVAPDKGEAILTGGDIPVAPVEGEGILTGATAAAEGALPAAP